MQHIITKFGGTSVSTRENWEKIAEITTKHILANKQPVIVCSALSQASNQLEKILDAALLNEHRKLFEQLKKNYTQLAEALDVPYALIEDDFQLLEQLLTGIALLKEASPKTRAQVLSMGELMMTRLGQSFLKNSGIDCLWFDAREALISSPLYDSHPDNFLAARCKEDATPILSEKLLKSGAKAIITQGFVAANPQGETVLLGRGGSDTSAALFAAKLKAQACEIWTDVPGIYTANPRQLPHARLLKQLNFDEAQEIASMGAKVLHPNSIPPVKHAGIPMVVKYTKRPEHSGTQISKDSDEHAPPIKSIQVKHNVILISIDALHMWQQVGFLADVFCCFKAHGFSIDLLSSSEFNVTVSLDSNTKLKDPKALDTLLSSLNQFGRARIIEPCSAVSLVGHHIRTILPELGPTLELFDAQQIYLMSLASNDLNLTFVVDESQADKLCQKLHSLLIENNPQSFYYSKSWHEEFVEQENKETPWWDKEREQLMYLGQEHAPCYVYNPKGIAAQAKRLAELKALDALFYAIKANSHPEVLKTLYQLGVGFECVSIYELKHILKLFPDIDRKRILFTPNFSAKSEYEYALTLGCHITIDNLYPLEHWPEIFSDHSILLRIDPGSGAGHHKYVCTGGNESKFGIPRDDLEQAAKLTQKANCKVMGLHAHSGSGILSPELWQETAQLLISEMSRFPDVKVLNLGGGLGIVEKPTQHPLDLTALNASLMAIKSQHPKLALWLEPGRFFVAESGVILAKVTQLKTKGKVRFVGLETGMNSLIRPALYGSYHEIVNLSRFNDEKKQFAHVVGPICESGDTLGYDRWLPDTQENDLFLIANAGAYGHCMSSSYNLRAPAKEVVMK